MRDAARPRGRADARAPARLDGDGRPQLLHLLRGALRTLAGGGVRSPRPRSRAADASHVPARGLCRRRSRRRRRARHRHVHPGRILDGWPGRPADLAAPSRRASTRSCCVRPPRTSPGGGPSGCRSSGSPDWPHSLASRRCRRAGWITDQVYLQRKSQTWSDWAIEQVVGPRLADGARGRAGNRRVLVVRLDPRRRRARPHWWSRCAIRSCRCAVR